MASKRAHRRRSCEGKQQYATETDAAAAAHAHRRRSLGVGYYRCDFGGHWHIGHHSKRIRQSITDTRRHQAAVK